MNSKMLKRIFALVLAVLAIVTMSVACTNDTEADSTDVASETVSSIRVMSYNILHPDWGKAPIEGRDVNLKNIINHYKPDVVGIQEVCETWHIAINEQLVEGGDYAFACKSTYNRPYNMTTLLYNTKTVKLVKEYVYELELASDIRVFAVAVFERISDGKQFVVTNSHPAPASHSGYTTHMENLMRFAKTEFDKYKDIPFIMTGDFNTREQTDMYNTFKSETGVNDAKYVAEKVERECCTIIGYPNGVIEEGNRSCIDHIFVNNNGTVKLFDTVTDHDVEKTSDHIPIYADIEF